MDNFQCLNFRAPSAESWKQSFKAGDCLQLISKNAYAIFILVPPIFRLSALKKTREPQKRTHPPTMFERMSGFLRNDDADDPNAPQKTYKFSKDKEKLMKQYAKGLNSDIKSSRRLFGQPLKLSPSGELPASIRELASYLTTHAIRTEGVFRVAGSQRLTDELQLCIDERRDTQLDSYDHFTLADTYKLFWRMLPTALLTETLYPCFIRAWDSEAGEGKEALRSEALLRVLSDLPPVHKQALVPLFRTLKSFLDHETENKMSCNNIAICFAPNVLRPQEETEDTIIHDTPKVVGIFACLLGRFYSNETDFYNNLNASSKPSISSSDGAKHGSTSGRADDTVDVPFSRQTTGMCLCEDTKMRSYELICCNNYYCDDHAFCMTIITKISPYCY